IGYFILLSDDLAGVGHGQHGSDPQKKPRIAPMGSTNAPTTRATNMAVRSSAWIDQTILTMFITQPKAPKATRRTGITPSMPIAISVVSRRMIRTPVRSPAEEASGAPIPSACFRDGTVRSAGSGRCRGGVHGG